MIVMIMTMIIHSFGAVRENTQSPSKIPPCYQVVIYSKNEFDETEEAVWIPCSLECFVFPALLAQMRTALVWGFSQ